MYFVLVVDDFPEEVHDTKVETAEISESELEAVEKNVESELKPEEKTFEELKAEDETVEETKELDKFYGFEQAEQAEYEADLEAELKSYGKPEEKIWQNTDDSGSI